MIQGACVFVVVMVLAMVTAYSPTKTQNLDLDHPIYCPDIACNPDEYNPVCGSNGVTYRNACYFILGTCGDSVTTLVHQGECKRDCHKNCNKKYDPVCGSNGVTYGNLCMYEVAHCKDESITISHQGQCRRKLCARRCGKIARPVCGSDGQTYINNCMFDIASCNNENLSVVYRGRCEDKEEIQCPRACPLIYRPVCDNNGKQYSNECELNIAICHDSSITPGTCHGQGEKNG
ncbi:four-domain proteases inhibitor-like [Homarus americanus]|uniref:Four-domain proteases inhibitor-like 1 n=1 Tax=Homarus americanus TaxID=6706 RepID=A0A8J5MWR8_HOMAM|nr:four-domain proteases inhibitor-like [Homarus americanus]KAG7166162.1 Four-domain proteases inhibitor-like 1 [Homarus americanus]